jgi:gliding motility-associated-like protein
LVNVAGTPDWTITFSLDGGTPTTLTASSSPISLGNSEGVYVVSGISDANCSNTASGTQTILIHPIPPAPTAGTDTTYCIGAELLAMTVTGGSGDFVWYSDETLTNPIGTGSTYMPTENLGSTIYYVSEQLDGCSGPTDNVTISFVSCDIIIPTAFTPDGDAVNDFWIIEDLDGVYPDNEVFVYNRWGNLLYSSEKGQYTSKPWDGTFDGNPMPVGSYYFIIATGLEKESLTGVVSIVLESGE